LLAPPGLIAEWHGARTFLPGPAQILHACASAAIMNAGHLDAGKRGEIGQQLAGLLRMTWKPARLPPGRISARSGDEPSWRS
jgi:hypothetical protein